jgi:hypothetical protein
LVSLFLFLFIVWVFHHVVNVVDVDVVVDAAVVD